MPCIPIKIGNSTGIICQPNVHRLKYRKRWYELEVSYGGMGGISLINPRTGKEIQIPSCLWPKINQIMRKYQSSYYVKAVTTAETSNP